MIRKLHLNESEDYTNESYLNEDAIDDILPDRTYVIPDVPEDFLYDVVEYGKSVGLKQNQFNYNDIEQELVITYSGYDRTGYEKCVDVRNWLLDLMEEEGYQYDECVAAKTSYMESTSGSLAQQIFDFLDDEGGYTDYNQKIEDVAEEFNLSKKDAESYVWDWASGLNKLQDDEEKDTTGEYTGSYTMDLSKQYDDRVIDGFVDYVCDYVEDNDYIGIYIYDTQYDKAALKLTFSFESDNNMPITNLDDIYDVFDTAVKYAVEDGMLISYMDNSVTESSNWRTNPNRLNDVKDVFVNEKISDKDYSQSKKGIAYKVFEFKNGKLYPPMVANAGNAATPTGVWLDAEPGEFVELDGLQRVVQRGVKGDRLKQRIANLDTLGPEERKKEVEKIKHSTLAYRPGWHLGDIPRAAQFDRHATWELLDELPEGVKISGNVSSTDTLAPKATKTNIGKYYYIKNLNKYAYIYADGDAKYFPYDFVWAECEYVADIDYQDEAMSYGYRKGNKFQHSLAGLPRVPEGGSYKYRTNPRPDTVPWVITGAIKVTKLLDDYDVQQILGSGAPERQGGNKTLAEMGLKQI